MSDEEAREDAEAKVKLYAQWAVAPKLTEDDISALLDAAKRASTWAADTGYAVGDVVMPTVRNGHRYRCSQAGTSSATEPDWPVRRVGAVTDGDDDPVLAWIEDGPQFESVYDWRAAVHEGWMVKAAKASELFAAGNEQIQQVYDHCIGMAAKYAPVEIA